MSWNRTSFSEIASGAPLQNIHPLGGKFPANIRISPTYGSGIWMISGSVLRGEYPLKGDDEIQHFIRHHVVVRLAAAHARDGLRRQRGEACCPTIPGIHGGRERVGRIR